METSNKKYPLNKIRNIIAYKKAITSLKQISHLISSSRIDFLKMDCEGAEYDILLNASDKTLGKIKKIAISTHDVEKYNGQILADFLVKKGFKVWFAPGGHPLYAKNKNI